MILVPLEHPRVDGLDVSVLAEAHVVVALQFEGVLRVLVVQLEDGGLKMTEVFVRSAHLFGIRRAVALDGVREVLGVVEVVAWVHVVSLGYRAVLCHLHDPLRWKTSVIGKELSV